MTIFGIGFLVPWLLWALAALPILWILLRAVPPAPIVRRFPAVALLLGLEDRETAPDRTPWWLLLLRCLAIALAILAFAQPVLNPEDRIPGKGPLLFAMDASWASAQSWPARHAKLAELARQAQQDGRPFAVVRLTDAPKSDAPLAFGPLANWQGVIDGLEPQAWEPDYVPWLDALRGLDGTFETVWFSDALARESRDQMAEALGQRGSLQVIEPEPNLLALRPARIEDGALTAEVLRLGQGPSEITLSARGPDPAGVERDLETVTGSFEGEDAVLKLSLDLPSELRNRVRALRVDGLRSAGAVTLTDDSVKRRKVAMAGGSEQEGAALVSPLHFLRKALAPTAEVIEASLADSLIASPDVVVLADVGKLPEAEATALRDWVEQGGLLLRFAGPQLAAAQAGQRDEDPLLPVRLRAGGRSVGGAMSWGEPKKLNPFPIGSPFEGLVVPEDVEVRSQVMAQPGPDLADRVYGTLADGTPLVTGRDLGQGRVVLVHVSANAEWSDLPLSGLFVQMLERLAVSARTSTLEAEDLAGLIWVPDRIVDGYGRLRDTTSLPGVEGERLATVALSSDMPPGLYRADERQVARNVIAADKELGAAQWPADTQFLTIARAEEVALMPWLLIGALALLLADILATLWISGRLQMRGAGAVAGVLLVFTPLDARADEAALLAAANNTVLAFVETGDTSVDEASEAGLLGLSTELFRRTSIEPIAPVGVNVETDDLTLYPFLYWPVTTSAPLPSAEATAKLNAFLQNGGLILFDTRDANIAASGGTPNGRRLQQIAARLVIPALEPVPSDHVLTRAFYLLQDFPGRYARSLVWVEAAPADAVQVEGMPFRNLNDGVTPVVVGGNDWARAWAIGDSGQFLFPVGRGANGERQREMAYRFGINLIMHTLTGNYKSDQVHVPALLDRLGQ